MQEKTPEKKETSQEDEKKTPQYNYQDFILPYVHKNTQGKAENMLDLSKNQPDILAWNSKE